MRYRRRRSPVRRTARRVFSRRGGRRVQRVGYRM